MTYDYIIVGAGIAGITAAEQVANNLNKTVLLIDKRDHIGGNCYDYNNEYGILIHKYGPHIFHTDKTRVFNYLSQFTQWNNYSHKVLGRIENTLVPIPFNLISIDKTFPTENSERLKDLLLSEYEVNSNIPILELKKSEDQEIQKLADYIYENIFLHYTEKQWGLNPEELDSSVTARVPIHVSYDCRYFHDAYQGLPLEGYSKMFNRMLANPNINIILDKDYKDYLTIDHENKKIYVNNEEFTGKLIFTGMIDEFFNYEYGELPYRSLIFDNETIQRQTFQENATINYPNEYHFTRITEYKLLTGQQTPYTTIQFEFPVPYRADIEEQSIPCYPIPQEKNKEQYLKYKSLADDYSNVIFLGRLAEYEYMNMDKVVDKVLSLFDSLLLEQYNAENVENIIDQ